MKVLFIGNSQMQAYNLPRMIATLSESAPSDHPLIETGQALMGGGTLKKYWEAGEGEGTPRGMIMNDQWDYVVIQEIYSRSEEDFRRDAEIFDDFIRKNDSRTMLFATASVTHHYSDAFSYPDSLKALNDMQIAFGKEHGIPVAAAGYAWMKYLGPEPSEQQLLDLYHEDKGHPGAKGTYIYACLLYALITGKNPDGLTSDFTEIRDGISIPREEAAGMQKAAWAQYRESTD